MFKKNQGFGTMPTSSGVGLSFWFRQAALHCLFAGGSLEARAASALPCSEERAHVVSAGVAPIPVRWPQILAENSPLVDRCVGLSYPLVRL